MARWVRPLLLVALVAAAVALALVVGVPPIDDVRTWVAAAGWAGPVLYAALYAGLSLTPAPASVLSIGAGVLFGLAVGVPVVLAGAVSGAVAGFALARWLGRATVEGVTGERMAHIDALLRRRGLLAVMGVRLVPVVPFAVLNMACGLSALRTRDYLVGTAVGMVPAVTAFVTIGAYGAEPGSTPFVLGVSAVVALLLGAAVLARRRAVGSRARSRRVAAAHHADDRPHEAEQDAADRGHRPEPVDVQQREDRDRSSTDQGCDDADRRELVALHADE